MKAGLRLARAIVHALRGWYTIVFVFPRLTQPERYGVVQVWSREMLAIIGITLEVQGTPPEHGPLLLVSNHISWLDILVIHAARHCRFVSKAEVRHWPLLGTLATGGGTLYIERASRRDALRVVHQMAESLKAGDIVGVFPEGTTTDGTQLLPFHGNLLQAAIVTDTPVQPLALRFVETATGETSIAARYDDDDSLLGSLWRTLSSPPVTARVRFGEVERPQGRDRRVWAQELRERVAGLLRG